MRPVAGTRRPVILVVDDQAAHILLTRKAFEKVEPEPEILEAASGMEALKLLETRVPDLILLDLNMPGMPGREVLAEIRANPDHRRIPVVIFSTSSQPRDVLECYADGANAYLQKPDSFTGLVETAQSVCHYWFSTSILPSSDP